MAVDHLSVAILYYFISNNNLSSYATKSEVFTSNYVTDPNMCTSSFSIVNGWGSKATHIPDAANNRLSTLLTIWVYREDIGSLTATRMQILIAEKGGGTFARIYENSAWSNWS